MGPTPDRPSAVDITPTDAIGDVGSNLQIRSSKDDTTWIVTVTGELDLAGRELFAAALSDAIPAAREKVLIDLSASTFIDSTGVHCLIEAKHVAVQHHVDLRIRRAPAPVHRVFELAGAEPLPFDEQ